MAETVETPSGTESCVRHLGLWSRHYQVSYEPQMWRWFAHRRLAVDGTEPVSSVLILERLYPSCPAGQFVNDVGQTVDIDNRLLAQ